MFVSFLGQAGISPPSSQPPASNAIANGPVTGVGPPVGIVPAHPRMGHSVPNLNAPTQGPSALLSSGTSLTNGPSSQFIAQQQVLSSNVHPGTSHTGSAFTPVTSSPHTSQHSPSVPPLPGQSQLGFPVQGQSNVQSRMPQFGQQTNYSGQTQGLQTSGLSPTAVPPVSQPLSALHSSKPKRPAMPMNTGPGYPGQQRSPSPRSTPPPPTGLPGSTMTQRTTPPPPTSLPGATIPQGSTQPPSSNPPGSSMPQGMLNSPPTGYSPMGQDSQAGRPISGRRRLYPTQVCVFEWKYS